MVILTISFMRCVSISATVGMQKKSPINMYSHAKSKLQLKAADKCLDLCNLLLGF